MYNKLFAKILDSSIWLEPNPTRIVWITFLAAMDEDGFAQFSSVRNLANRAMVTVDEAAQAVATLEAPDPDSNNKAHEGRRLERVPGGWMVLNAEEHRNMVTRAIAREKTRERVARFRSRHKEKLNGNGDVTPSESVSESGSVSNSEKEQEGAPAPPRAKPPKSDKGTRLPEDWKPSETCQAYAKKKLPRVDLDELVASFHDHWKAANGPTSIKRDWDAAWRTWVRRATTYGYPMVTGAAQQERPQVRFDANGRQISG